MKYEFGVTIGSRLDDQDIRDTQTFKHVHVLDLRRCINNGPFPIEERTLRKLVNFQVTYEQMPMSLYSASSRAENELFNTITNTKGNVLILIDEMVPLPASVSNWIFRSPAAISTSLKQQATTFLFRWPRSRGSQPGLAVLQAKRQAHKRAFVKIVMRENTQ